MKIITYTNSDYNSDMDYTALRLKFKQKSSVVESYYVFNQDATHIYFGSYHNCFKFVGKKSFLKSEVMGNMTYHYKTGKFYGNCTFTLEELKCLFTHLRCEWIVPELDTFRTNLRLLLSKKVLKAIITKKVTNPEALYKFILKNSYNALGIISYKTFKEYLKFPFINLPDVIDFTVNPEESLKAFLTIVKQRSYSIEQIVRDTLASASILNERIDLRWSEKRIRKHHQWQIEKMNILDRSAKNTASIYTDTFKDILPEYAKILNNELAVFDTGNDMHNCIYTNYWHLIQKHRYFAILFDIDGEKCLMGMRMNYTTRTMDVDQCYKSRNEPLNNKQYKIVSGFVGYHARELFHRMDKDIIERNVKFLEEKTAGELNQRQYMGDPFQ